MGEEAPEENLELTSILSNTMDTSSVSQEEQLRRALYVVHAQVGSNPNPSPNPSPNPNQACTPTSTSRP